MGYFVYYEVGPGSGLVAEYESAIGSFKNKFVGSGFGTQVSGADLEAKISKLLKNPDRIKAGLANYQSKCASCHGQKGEGLIGPNLTDDNWISGGKLSQISNVITKGVGDKGMPPWGPILKEDEINELVVLIRSIRGTKPVNAKPPQGELVKIE